ncbi:mucin-2 [Eupeodes corollae]|uniref:mucin-2 n=1 Tax=Eupeodes corollae TaxID=290404 RepID=UPI0024920704|nr:mucin-2 [Eupeodes corollae]
MSKVLCTTCTMETTSWLLVIICMVLVHSTNFSNSAPTESNSPGNDHVTGIYPTATISPTTTSTTTTTMKMKTTMPMTMPMTSAAAAVAASASVSAKSWSSQKPSRSKHITKSILYKKPSKDKGGRAKVPFLSPTLVPTGYDVEKDISHHKEVEAPMATTSKITTTTTATVTTTIDTVVDNVNGPKDYTNKKRTNTSTLRHLDSPSLLGVSDGVVGSLLSTNANGDEDSGKDIDFISDSRTTKADETYATTEGYHAKAPGVAGAAVALSTTTMPTTRVENPVSNMETIPLQHVEGAKKSIASSVVAVASVTYTPSVQSKSMPVNASLSFSSPLTTMVSPSSAPPKLPDVGHDGVKVTKKKQLFDKHFIAASSPLLSPSPSHSPSGLSSSSLHTSMRKDNPWPPSLMSMNKPTKSNSASGKKLMEVPNGYLGPIMMKEKTFSVSHHHGKKPKPSLVEQKLKDKKLVEIIAPTALMEPISKTKNSQPDFVAIDMTTTVLMPTTTTTITTTAATTTTTKVAALQTTEEVKDSTEVKMVGKSKKKEIESETATTYFLVAAQEGNNEASSKEVASETVRPPAYPEMEPLNSGEIETTLREIYAEVINAMEGGSRTKTTSTEIPVTENKSNPATTSLPLNPTNFGNIDRSGKLSFDSDHQDLSENINQRNGDGGSSTDSALFSMGTPLTLNIFDKKYYQSSAKDTTSTAYNLPTAESTSAIEKFTSSSTVITARTDPPKLAKDEKSTESIEQPKNLPENDEFVTRKTIKAEISSTEALHIYQTAPNKTAEQSYELNSSTETPSRVQTHGPIKSEEINISSTTESTTSPEIMPVTSSPFRALDKSSKPVLNDELIVTARSLITDSYIATTQSSSSTTKPLKPPHREEPTIGTPIEDISSTTTKISTVYSIVDTDHPDERNHFPTTSGSIKQTTFPQAQHQTMTPHTELNSELISSSTTKFSRNEDHPEDKTTPKNLPIFTTIDYQTSKTTDFSSLLKHDSSTISPSPIPTAIPNLEVSSTSIPQATQNNEPSESKISDIQIEVYDSTLEPIVSATNFKHSTDVSSSSSHGTTKHSHKDHPQERFTQYVVDRSSDFATQESSAIARTPGKPEPAAIEIHINVSEGFGNESEDLEFLYRQSDFRKFPSKKPPNSLKPFDVAPQNETSNEAAEEIVVEIIDGNSNSTENSASRENLNVNPVFTFRSDDDSQVELKNVKYYPEDRPPKDSPKSTDDFFVPHVGQQPSSANKPLMDRDSDTIFYISNTEVKVGESLPTTNTYDTQMKKSRLESQFFPANYEEHKKAAPQRYEEDIILSPPKNGPLKVIRRPLDISYVGESIMEVEQVTVTTTVPPSPVPGSTPDVIIEPAVLPEMAIGVPVIGELPPQIELKEIDYMPNFDGNKEESSIQYGGDLIDEGGAMGVGFDMDSYPLGNLGMGNKNDASAAVSSQMLFNHRVNHLKKDVLSADLGGSSETADGNDLLRQANDSINGTALGEKMGNATAYSVIEDRTALNEIMHFFTLRTLVFIGLYTLIPLVLVILLIYIWRDYNRKYKRNPFNAMGRNSSTDPLDAEKGNGGDGDADGVETPEELRASSLAFGATTNTPSLEICTDSNEATNGNAYASDGDGDGRSNCCNNSNSNSRAASDTMDLGEIKAYNSGDVQEENSTLTIHNCCNFDSPRPRPQQMVSSNIPPQSATTTTNAAVTAAGASSASTSASATATAKASSGSGLGLGSASTANANASASATSGSNSGTMHCNYSGANGSITTMTLKNNHLIVETEERNDISRDTRVTKMHYNNSEKDGVFVVEVSRGADSKIMPGSPVSDGTEKRPFNIDADVKIVQSDTEALLSNHEKVQVHQPPSLENLINHGGSDEIDTNHLHQIDEVDEFEECPRFTKNSNTGLSQSDLSSSSSVDSNKRYSYGNQELYTIEKQDYTTPSPTATKAPHPHAESKHPQPENHNDDNGHPENGHCLEKSPTPAPKCDSSIAPPPPPSTQPPLSSDKVHDMNGHHESAVESKPKITAALLKQDTVVVNEVTNGSSHDNGNEKNDHQNEENVDIETEIEKANEDTPQNPTIMDNMKSMMSPSEPAVADIKTHLADYTSANTENGFDSIISLPDPPSTEEIKQMNDIILMETNQLDSLPPPPPPATDNYQHHNGNGNSNSNTNGNGVDQNGDGDGDSHSIVSSTESPIQTPTKVMKPLVPPTITVADTSALTTTAADIPVHANGNCMTSGHATTAIAVEVSGSS